MTLNKGRSIFEPFHGAKVGMWPGLAVFVLVLWSPASCSGGSDDDQRILAVIAAEQSHTHSSDLSYRALRSGIRRFNLSESAGHDHTIDVKEEDFALIELGQAIGFVSTTAQNHTHTVTIQRQELD